MILAKSRGEICGSFIFEKRNTIMIKMNFGAIGNYETGKYEDIVVRAVIPNNIKDILIGGGAVMAGIIYLTVTAFKNGARAYEKAEFDTLEKQNLIH